MSIVEIAKQAKVSISTVSRYFNQPDKVSTDAADRIRTVTARLQYQPRIRRPGPKTPDRVGIKTGTIVFFSLGQVSPEEMLRKPAFPVLLGSIQRSLIDRKISLLLAHLEPTGAIPSCIDPRVCDGVILFGRCTKANVMEKLLKKLENLPAVWCFREHNDENRHFDHILYDNRAVGAIAAEYLAERGHKQVGVFNTDPLHTAFKERVTIFCHRAEELGMTVTKFIAHGNETAIHQYQELAKMFLYDSSEITGGFFCSDDIMLGVNNELRASGVPVMKLDCIGCNDDEVLLRYLSPRPATINIKMAEVGKMAVAQLLRRINEKQKSYSSEILIKPELVKGGNATDLHHKDQPKQKVS